MTPWEIVSTDTPAGLLAATVLMIFLGYLIPKWWVRERIKEKDEELARERERNEKLMAGLTELMTYARTANQVLEALKSALLDRKDRS